MPKTSDVVPRRRRGLLGPSLVLAAGLAVACGGQGGGNSDARASSSASGGTSLATQLRRTPPPWIPPRDASRYIKLAGLTPMTAEGTQVHYHAHLDVIANGKPVPVPANIGIDLTAQRISPLHTHDATGVLHIEAPAAAVFTLGQLFIEWDVRLTGDCIGSLCAGQGEQLRFYVNGHPYTGDPTRIVLKEHEEIAVLYGTPASMPSPAATYDFGRL